jgi:NAD(P)-dependent dehydrogenase (short-subunit alcohol dehydrogenase family)
MITSPWVLGTEAAAPLATALGAQLTLVPEVTFDDRWSQGSLVEQWRRDTAAGGWVTSVVVAVWTDPPDPVPVVELDVDHWLATTEAPLALWFATLAVAAARCADGGQVVAVVDRPDPRESAGRGGPAAVADAVEVMTRSLSEAHRDRGVRVNAVTTPSRLTGGGDRVGPDLAAAVAMLLSSESAGVTANTIRVGGSR